MTLSEDCELVCIEHEKVMEILPDLLPEEIVLELAETFRLLGDPTRVRIIHALSLGELCVCDLAALLEISVSAVSHQLRQLRNLRVVRFRKAGKIVYYSLDDQHIFSLLQAGVEHIQHCLQPTLVRTEKELA